MPRATMLKRFVPRFMRLKRSGGRLKKLAIRSYLGRATSIGRRTIRASRLSGARRIAKFKTRVSALPKFRQSGRRIRAAVGLAGFGGGAYGVHKYRQKRKSIV